MIHILEKCSSLKSLLQPAKKENNDKANLLENNIYKSLGSEKPENIKVIREKKIIPEEKQENSEKNFENNFFLKTSFFKLELSPICSSQDIKELKEPRTIKNKFFNTITCFPKVNELEKEKPSIFMLHNHKQNQLFSKKLEKICNNAPRIINNEENNFNEGNEELKNKKINFNIKIKDLEHNEKKEDEIIVIKEDQKNNKNIINQELEIFESDYVTPNINHQRSNEFSNFTYSNRKRNFYDLKNQNDEINQRKVSTAFEEKRRNFINYQNNDVFKNLFSSQSNFYKKESDNNQRAATAFETCRKSIGNCNIYNNNNIIFPTCLIKKIDNNIIIRPNTVDPNDGMKKRFTIKDLI